MAEQLTVNQRVVSSSLTPGAQAEPLLRQGFRRVGSGRLDKASGLQSQGAEVSVVMAGELGPLDTIVTKKPPTNPTRTRTISTADNRLVLRG